MKLEWNDKHAEIFEDFIYNLHISNIKYIVLRNYRGLPKINKSKDVDVIIKPGKLKEARNILLQIYKKHGMEYYVETVFGKVHCMLGIKHTKPISIHIDLIEGYLAKGYQIFSFEELYSHTKIWNGFRAMDDYFNGVMLLIYKQFGYRKAILKLEYQEQIQETYLKYKDKFYKLLKDLTNEKFADEYCDLIERGRFDEIADKACKFTKLLRKYCWKKFPILTLLNIIKFQAQKIDRIIIRYRKFAKTFAVMAPDGTGKTTFLNKLLDQMSFYYVNLPEDKRFDIYHFRPNILPNLGAVGEKAGIMKQDTNFTDPHRSKPANPISSLIRIAYYTLDYIVGWQICVRKDVQFDKYTVFDRYSYDFIVDPLRTKLNLPYIIRRFFVILTPKPDIVFVLNASPKVIYSRKKELPLDEIKRQLIEYQRVADSSYGRFIQVDAEQKLDQMVYYASKILLEKFACKI